MFQSQPMTTPTLSPRQRAKAALKSLRAEAGSDAAIAKALTDIGTRISRQAVNNWVVVQERYLRAVSVVFGNDPKELRPDLSAFQIKKAMELPLNPPPDPRSRDRPRERAR